MTAYILRRLLLLIPTLFGILLINFAIIQFAPGGPVEQIIAQIRGIDADAAGRISGATGRETASGGPASRYRGAQGLDPEFIRSLEKQFGFDQPAHRRFLRMCRDYLTFNFGHSYYRDRSVLQLIREKLPVSVSLGLWSTLLIYAISIPLGIRKAVRDGSRFDSWTSALVVAGNAIPSFLFAVLLVIVFAGGRYLDWFPLRGLTSENWASLSWGGRILDYAWHLVLPVATVTIGGFATLTMLTKNSFLDQIHLQYVTTAYAKGCTPRQALYGHVFRNAMLIVISGFPAALIMTLFTGSVLVEVIFSLDGIGLLGFDAALKRDYPVMMGTLFIFELLALLLNLLSDVIYTVIDPRIDFEGR
ncbi:MAG: microcin C ABC transporter permease YejB [Lentisphaerae bacterium]|nr:microcin C ABC transporter permease YejB [Lentisphaerota bacterium]